MKDLIESVARGLGWISDYGDGDVDLCYNGHTYHGGTPECYIHFAAYAKAEMAKRGYAFHVGSESVGAYWPRHSSSDQREFVGAAQLDDPDPLSEAEAVLRCIVEALESH